MAKLNATFLELMTKLMPVEKLDEGGLALYRSIIASTDEATLMTGSVELLERLCSLGHLRRLERSAVNGKIRLRYRNLVTLETISINLPRDRARQMPTEPATPAPAPLPPQAGNLNREVLEAVAASSSQTDLSGALKRLFDLLLERVGFDRIGFFISQELMESQGAALRDLEDLLSGSGDASPWPALVQTRVEATGEPLIVPDLLADSGYIQHFSGSGQRSLAAAPLKSDDRVYGVLGLLSRTPSAYDADALDLLSYVAQFAGGLLKRRLELAELIFIDQTTQIHNRRYFDEQLEREVERCKRSGESMALLIADLDHFKEVNDTLGHAAGDSVLRQVARVLAENARQVDIVARFGGEEFGIILPSIDLENAKAVSERFRSAVESHAFSTGAPTHPEWDVTISIGGALYPHDASSITELVDRADRLALYQAKDRGRNRIVFWTNLTDKS